MTNPTAVVFDLGGVLIDWNPRYLYKNIFYRKEDMEWFLQNVCTPEWHEQVDKGLHPSEITSSLIEKFPKYSAEINAYHGRVKEMFGGEAKEMVQLLETLDSNGVPLYCITNLSSEIFPWLCREYPFLYKFKEIVVSGEEKIVKPDPRIFQILFSRANLKPETAVFIDDRLDNVDAAKALGMYGIHHTTPEKTIQALKELQFF